jgi:hypothetical protein
VPLNLESRVAVAHALGARARSALGWHGLDHLLLLLLLLESSSGRE